MAVDSIFLKEDGIESVRNPLLANVVAWMVWKMKPEEANPERIVELVKQMGELIDGYVINVVRKVDNRIEGYKLTLARDEQKIEYLSGENGNTLKQVNIIDPAQPAMKWALPPKRMWRGGWKYFTSRIKTLTKHTETYQHFCQYSLNTTTLPLVHGRIQQLIFGDLASDYVSPDLGAVCVGFIDQEVGTSVSCKLNDSGKLADLEYAELIN